jgi:hypothetical protein
MTTEFLDWEVEECIDILTDRAKETGDTHNAMMVAQYERAGKVWKGAPNAWQSSNSWYAVLIIRKLQKETESLKLRLSKYETS